MILVLLVPQPGGQPEPETIVCGGHNESESDVAFECLVDVLCSPTVLKPGEHTDIPITYTPREVARFTSNIPEINGLYTIDVGVSGEGIVMKLEFEKPDDQDINFGSIRVGHVVRRSVRLVNKSQKLLHLSWKTTRILQKAALRSRWCLLTSAVHCCESSPVEVLNSHLHSQSVFCNFPKSCSLEETVEIPVYVNFRCLPGNRVQIGDRHSLIWRCLRRLCVG